MGNPRTLWELLTKKRVDPSKKHFNNNNAVGENIYGNENDTIGNHLKRFHWVHFIFKYKLLLPSVAIFHKMMGKRLVKRVPDLPQYKYVKVLEKSIDEAVIDWYEVFLYNTTDRSKPVSEYVKAAKDQYILKVFKEVALTVCCYDTAYMEMLPFLFSRITKNLQELPDEHLLFVNNDTHDPSYFALLRQQSEEGVELKNVKIRVLERVGGP